jgi:hypothetical protein
MGKISSENFVGRGRRIFGSRLPPGVRDTDCDGRPDPLVETGERRLWLICGPLRQERLSARFAELHAELLRDAILDAEDSSVLLAPTEFASQFLFVGSIWSAWIRFRDRALREMCRCGELPEA